MERCKSYSYSAAKEWQLLFSSHPSNPEICVDLINFRFFNLKGESCSKVARAVCCFKRSDPIPGGCNLELSLENDPNLYLTTSASQTRVQFAYGNLNIADVRQPCGSSSQRSELIYEVYQMYLTERHFDEDTFFATVARMLKADDVTASSRLV